MGNGVSFAMVLSKSGRAYRIGFVGMSSNFGGHGGGGIGFEYRTRTRRSILLSEHCFSSPRESGPDPSPFLQAHLTLLDKVK